MNRVGGSGPVWSGEAPAKVNLLLRVLAREASGYHQIETVFQALELADGLRLELRPGEGVGLETTGVGATQLGPDEENLAVRAARALLAEAGGADPPGVRIRLKKRIPHGAGLGGGSSDAAAVLRGMNVLLGEPLSAEALVRIGGRLGADVPFFLTGASRALAWGRGDRLLPLPPLPSRAVVLAVPAERSSTADAYALLAKRRRASGAGPAPAVVREAPGSWDDVANQAENDFEETLFPHRPDLASLREALARLGARPALLAGSGSAVFGVFEDEGGGPPAGPGGTSGGAGPADPASEAVGVIEERFPGVRTIRTRTRG